MIGTEGRFRTIASGGPGQCCPGFSVVVEDGSGFDIPAGFGHWGCQCSISITVEEIPEEESDEHGNEITPLSLGSFGDEVRRLQELLNELGYTDDNGRRLIVDGVFGIRTEQAVNKFKDDHLPGGNRGELRGIVGATTWEYLDNAVPRENIDRNVSGQDDERPFASMTLQEKRDHIITPLDYSSSETARRHMVTIEVPIWIFEDNDPNNEKVASSRKVTVNGLVANDLVSIFTQIFNDPEQFVLYDNGNYVELEGFNYRTVRGGTSLSHHYIWSGN